MRLRVAPQASGDLEEIWLYLARESGNLAIATRVVNTITGTLGLLANYPHMGRSRESDLRGDRRSFPVNNYVIFYRIKSGQVQILRVLHASRDAQAIFIEE